MSDIVSACAVPGVSKYGSTPILNTEYKYKIASYLLYTALDNLEQYENGFFQQKLGGSLISKLPCKTYNQEKETDLWHRTFCASPRRLYGNSVGTPNNLVWIADRGPFPAVTLERGLPLFNLGADVGSHVRKTAIKSPEEEAAEAELMKPRRIISERKVGPFIECEEVTDDDNEGHEDEEDVATSIRATMTYEQTLQGVDRDGGATVAGHTLALAEIGGEQVIEDGENSKEAAVDILDGRINDIDTAQRPLDIASNFDFEDGTDVCDTDEFTDTSLVKAAGTEKKPFEGEVKDRGATSPVNLKKSHRHRAKRSKNQKKGRSTVTA